VRSGVTGKIVGISGLILNAGKNYGKFVQTTNFRWAFDPL
jgi:hypothetical protein